MNAMKNSHPNRRGGFTLIEMLVVMGMIAILMGSVFAGLSGACKQAKITKAQAEIRQIIGACLAYEASKDAEPGIPNSWGDATESNLRDLLGGNGNPVFLNATTVGGSFRDPWNRPYQVRLKKNDDDGESPKGLKFTGAISFSH